MGERYASTTFIDPGASYASKTIGVDYGGVAIGASTYAAKVVDSGDYASKLFTEGGSGGTPTPTPTPAPLTARSAVLMPSANGATQSMRYEAPQLSNWMRSGTAFQSGFMMLDLSIADAQAMMDGVALRLTDGIAGTGAQSTSTTPWVLYYNTSAAAANKRSLAISTRTPEMSGAGDPATIAYSPAIREEKPFTAFMLYTVGVGIQLCIAYADGTLDKGAPVALPASFVGRASPGVFSLGGFTAVTPAMLNFFRGQIGRFAYARATPTDAEMIRIAQGESPADIYGAAVDRYYPLNGPADLAPATGAGNLTVVSNGTDQGWSLRRAGSLSGAQNGTVGFAVDAPIVGHGWGIDLDNPAAGAPVDLSIKNTKGAATTFEARFVLHSDGQTVHKDWTVMTGGAVAPGATATLTVPGVLSSKLVHVEVRRTDAPGLTWCSHPVGVGPDIVDDGQSQRQIWGIYRAGETAIAAVGAAIAPCVTICCVDGNAVIHRQIDTARKGSIGPAAFAARWAAITGGAWCRIRSTAIAGSSRVPYYTNALISGSTTYRYWGDNGVSGTGLVADVMAKCGNRFSAIMGHYSVDDYGTDLPGNLNTYLFAAGAPARHWGQFNNPLGVKLWLRLHDRAKRATVSIVEGYYDTARAYAAANPAAVRLGPPNTVDKRFEASTDQLHQAYNEVEGNARMGAREAVWLAGLLGYSGGLANAGTLTGVASSAPFSSATCTFSLAAGAALTCADGSGQVYGLEISINGGAAQRVPPANATISGNTVVVTGITGAAAANQIRLRLHYDHVWGAEADNATRFAADNVTLEKVLASTVPNAPAEPSWAKGVPLRPSLGWVQAA